MKITRKDFLRLTGLSVLAAGGLKAARLLAAAAQTSARAVIPGKPRRQLGMVVDLRKCREHPGCDQCVRACNAAHNIPHIPNPDQEVKWIWAEAFPAVFPLGQNPYTEQNYPGKAVPVLCNHCDDPACVRVCPTGATWKREEDGIVMMDWHRCIGCKYCVVACPYGSRSFNFVDPRPYIAHVDTDFPTRSMGVVEKCDFCAELLAEGKPPACAEACPAKAIVFGDLSDPRSAVSQARTASYTVRRKPELGTGPNVSYIV
ncbi:MAG: sulfate reduction electron transfer complex DsrMKJOP subunit DsrO [Acidobacteriota bacterium]